MSAKKLVLGMATAAGLALVAATGGAGAPPDKSGPGPVALAAPARGGGSSAAAVDPSMLLPAPPNAPKAMSPKYGILLSRSIFAKDQRAAPDRAEATSRPAAPPRPEESVVFTGALEQDNVTWGFFEDIKQRQTLVRRPGESLCGGMLASVTLNSVDFQSSSGRSRQIAIGQNMEGKPIDLGFGSSSSYSGSSGSSSSSSSDRYSDRSDRSSDGRSRDYGRSSRDYGRSSDRSDRSDRSSSYGSRGDSGRSSRDYGGSDRGPSDRGSSDRGSSDRGSSDRSSNRGAPPSGPGGDSGAAPAPPPLPDGGGDLVERMRQRRMQELGK
jgi:hypothetical protein